MDKISHYKIDKRLSDEDQPETLLARDTRDNQLVALRFVDQSMVRDNSFREQYITDMKRLYRAERSHIAKLINIENDGVRHFIVREYIEGQTIKELASQELFEYKIFLHLALQITRGIKAAHEIGIVHGHISSHNIIISQRGQAKIVDFGLPQVHPDQVDTCSCLPYLSPEQMRGRIASEYSDLFSLGVVFYEMLTGKLPFGTGSKEQLLSAIESETGPLQIDAEHIMPSDARLLMERLLAGHPTERCVNAGELLASLEAMLAYQFETQRISEDGRSEKSPRTYLMLSILTALLVIFWLVVTTYKH